MTYNHFSLFSGEGILSLIISLPVFWIDVEEFEELDNSTHNATKRIMPFTFRNEEEDCLEIPNWCCSICCRVLYYEEVYTMNKAVENELSRFLKLKSWTWPVLMYPLFGREWGSDTRCSRGFDSQFIA